MEAAITFYTVIMLITFFSNLAVHENFRKSAFIAVAWPLVLIIEIAKGGYEYFRGEP